MKNMMLQVKNYNLSLRRSSLIAGLLAFAVLSAYAQPADCGTNLQWEFESATGRLIFTSPEPTQRATMSYSIDEGVPWAEDSTAITSIVLPDSLTNIAPMAFSGCTALTAVTLPDSLTTVGMQAFNGCTALENVSLGNVKKIANNAFSGCVALEAISLPASLERTLSLPVVPKTLRFVCLPPRLLSTKAMITTGDISIVRISLTAPLRPRTSKNPSSNLQILKSSNPSRKATSSSFVTARLTP